MKFLRFGKVKVTKLLALLLVSGCCVSAMTACDTEEKPTSKIDNSNAKEAKKGKGLSEEKEPKLQIGGTYEDKSVKLTVNNATLDYKVDDPYGFYDLEEGMQYLLLEVTFENVKSKDNIYVSSGDFDCYADNKKCEEEYISDVCGDTIMGDLSPGRNLGMKVLYKIPASAQKVEVEYTPNFWSNKKVKIEIK